MWCTWAKFYLNATKDFVDREWNFIPIVGVELQVHLLKEWFLLSHCANLVLNDESPLNWQIYGSLNAFSPNLYSGSR